MHPTDSGGPKLTRGAGTKSPSRQSAEGGNPVGSWQKAEGSGLAAIASLEERTLGPKGWNRPARRDLR